MRYKKGAGTTVLTPFFLAIPRYQHMQSSALITRAPAMPLTG